MRVNSKRCKLEDQLVQESIWDKESERDETVPRADIKALKTRHQESHDSGKESAALNLHPYRKYEQ